MKDSEGNALTQEQAAFFEDSKVRDRDENPKVLFHQTGEVFTAFYSSIHKYKQGMSHRRFQRRSEMSSTRAFGERSAVCQWQTGKRRTNQPKQARLLAPLEVADRFRRSEILVCIIVNCYKTNKPLAGQNDSDTPTGIFLII